MRREQIASWECFWERKPDRQLDVVFDHCVGWLLDCLASRLRRGRTESRISFLEDSFPDFLGGFPIN